MGGEEQREEAIALRDTFGQVAKDISSKAGEFHDVTADAASQGAHALADTDSEFGGKLNDLANNPDPTPTPHPIDRRTTNLGSATGMPSAGPVDDDADSLAGRPRASAVLKQPGGVDRASAGRGLHGCEAGPRRHGPPRLAAHDPGRRVVPAQQG